MQNADTYVAAYFENFHPSFPLLHRQSVLGMEMPKLSKQIIVSIGILYASINVPEEDSVLILRQGQELWLAGHDELWRLVGGFTLFFPRLKLTESRLK